MRNAACWVLLLSLGCGGAPAAPAASESAGAEQSLAASPEPTPESEAQPPESEPQPAPSGPSRLTVQVRVKGEAVPAQLRLLDGDGQLVAEGVAGTALEVSSGEYTLETKLAEGSPLVDRPSERRQLTLLPAGEITEEVSFGWARIKLNVKVNGRAVTDAKVTLLKGGASVVTLQSQQDYVMISPGRYEADVEVKGTKIRVTNLMFPEGGTRDVPVSVQL